MKGEVRVTDKSYIEDRLFIFNKKEV
ncbi:hypothetical protein [Enterococcus faecium]